MFRLTLNTSICIVLQCKHETILAGDETLALISTLLLWGILGVYHIFLYMAGNPQKSHDLWCTCVHKMPFWILHKRG